MISHYERSIIFVIDVGQWIMSSDGAEESVSYCSGSHAQWPSAVQGGSRSAVRFVILRLYSSVFMCDQAHCLDTTEVTAHSLADGQNMAIRGSRGGGGSPWEYFRDVFVAVSCPFPSPCRCVSLTSADTPWPALLYLPIPPAPLPRQCASSYLFHLHYHRPFLFSFRFRPPNI